MTKNVFLKLSSNPKVKNVPMFDGTASCEWMPLWNPFSYQARKHWRFWQENKGQVLCVKPKKQRQFVSALNVFFSVSQWIGSSNISTIDTVFTLSLFKDHLNSRGRNLSTVHLSFVSNGVSPDRTTKGRGGGSMSTNSGILSSYFDDSPRLKDPAWLMQ